MPHDNVIDFGSLKKRHNSQKGESIESDAAFQAEMEAMLDKIPAHMQEFVGRRFTFLMMYSVVTARVAEMLTHEGYDPSDFDRRFSQMAPSSRRMRIGPLSGTAQCLTP